MIYKTLKRCVDIGSKLAAIGIFFLALFGYFYTVKPKFFLDHLKVKTSTLEIKNNALNESIKIKEQKITQLQTEKELKLAELQKKVHKLENDINNKQANIVKLNNEKNKNINENKYVLWRIFLNKTHIQTSVSSDLKVIEKSENEYIIKHTEQDKKILKENAPYLILKKHFSNLQYSSKYALINENIFNEFNAFIIDSIEKQKSKLIYNVNLEELVSLQEKYNQEIKKLKPIIYDTNIATRIRFNTIDQIHEYQNKYDLLAQKRYIEVEKTINNFINNVSLSYVKQLNLDILPVNKISIDKRKYKYCTDTIIDIF